MRMAPLALGRREFLGIGAAATMAVLARPSAVMAASLFPDVRQPHRNLDFLTDYCTPPRVVVVGEAGAINALKARGINGVDFILADSAATGLANGVAAADIVIFIPGADSGTDSKLAGMAQAAREMGTTTVGMVNEKLVRTDQDLQELEETLGTLVVVQNASADEGAYWGVRSLIDPVTLPGLIGIDMSDISTVIGANGKGKMTTAVAHGNQRAAAATEAAMAGIVVKDVRRALVTITTGADATLLEIDEVCNHVLDRVGPDADIVFGGPVDEMPVGNIRVSMLVIES